MKKKVEILCVLDRSGSMSLIMVEAVAAFNEFVKQQQKVPGKANLTLVAFDDQYKVVFDRIKIKDVPELKVTDVPPRGMTALNDAIGKAINNIPAKSKDVVLLIQTDGYENASQEYKSVQIKELIAGKEKLGWDISFIGAGVDAFSIGGDFGIKMDKCMNITKDAKGMRDYVTFTSSVATGYRGS